MKSRRDLLLLFAMLACTAAAPRIMRLCLAPTGLSEAIIDDFEDVATLSGGGVVMYLGLRYVRREAQSREEVARRSHEALQARVAQQAAVAALGQRALEGAGSHELIHEAVEIAARTLDVEHSSLLEHDPSQGCFVLRAGIGFGPEEFGRPIALDGDRSMSGYALSRPEPVVANDLAAETRFTPSPYYVSLGVRSSAVVRIPGDERPFGVFGVFTTKKREFTDDDTAFLRSVANVVAAALSRERVADEAHRFFEMSQDMLAITDFTGVIRRVNPALARTIGDGGNPVGRAYLDFVHPEDRAASAAETLLARAPGVVTVENRCFAPDGALRRVEWSVQADVERGLVYAVARDVTDRRRMEAEHALLARAVGQAAETMIVTGPDGVIEYVNPAFTRVTGWSRAEAVGKRASLLKSGEHDAAFYAGLWAKLLAGEVWSGRIVNRRKDGSTYQAEGTISPLRDAAGELVNFVAVMRDVTRESALETQFHQAQKMEVVGRLAGGVAHDFNNLLCVMEGYGSILFDEIERGDPRRDHVVQIRAASRSATVLTRQLLAFSRRQEMQPRVLDPNVVVRDAAKMWTRLLGEDVRLELRLAADLGRVKADPGQLDQVLMNLAVNARDAMEGGGKLTIETANVELDAAFVADRPGACEGRFVRISVADTGMGMDAATLARIFEPFFTTKAPGKGTGLGLATVYGIVKQSEGYVEATSELRRGAVFHVYLPRVDRELTAEDLSDDETKPPASNGNETVLVLEDEKPVRLLLCAVLRGAGYAVLESARADEAVAAAEAHAGPIALLVSDVVLPDENGPAAALRIGEDRPDLRVLYVSGHTFETMSRRGEIDAGIDLLLKPFSPDTLLRRVRAAIDAPALPDRGPAQQPPARDRRRPLASDRSVAAPV